MIWLLLAQAAPLPADAVAAAIATMTIEEKAAQLQSSAPADAEAGLPAYDWWNEGLHGLARSGPSTVFPQAIGMAATWDTALVERIGDVVSTEARAKFNRKPANADRRIYEGLTIWSPNINIFRDPRWGRGQETYGEDPVLTGLIGTAFVRGLQGPDPVHPKVIATPKHFAAHSGPEAGRDGFAVMPSPRDMEATYLPAFRMTVTEGRARSLMCAYNSIQGIPACAHPGLMVDRLRRDWGFRGFTVSDCDAISNIHLFQYYRADAAESSAVAIRGGNDLNCGTAYAGLPAAVKRGLISEGEVDVVLRRVLGARRDLGIAFGARSPWSRIGADQVATPAHGALALEAAHKSIVLLKNDAGRLPLKPSARIAVIGANADDLGVLQANYHGTAVAPVTPLEGLRQRFDVTFAQGSVLAEGAPVVVPETAYRNLTAQYSSRGKLVATRAERRIDYDYNRAAPLPELPAEGPFAVRWTATFAPPSPGEYRLIVEVIACWKYCKSHDSVRLWIDGRQLAAGEVKNGRVEVAYKSDGRAVPFRLELDHTSGDEGIAVMWVPPADPQLAEAVAAAEAADVAVVFVGLSPDLEGEALKVQVPGFVGGDRTDIALPEPQLRLLRAIRETGKPVVLVLASGGAVAVDPALADAILAMWYPGEAGGTALADTLAGLNNPGGRLPVTFYRSTTDLPAFVDYGMKERTYRYFTGTPLWGFGHGLSYTSFGYDRARARGGTAGEPVTVSARLTNRGVRAGDEVVQVYVVPPDAGERPNFTDPVLQRQLAGFTRVTLAPGGARDVALTLDPRILSVVLRDGTRRVLPGRYRIWIGGGQPDVSSGTWISVVLTGTARDLPK